MDAQEITIDKLFGRAQFVVPLFQRGYSWDIAQWEALWEDIKTLLDEMAMRSGDDVDTPQHFLGAVILQEIPKTPFPQYEVIDGQQRISTLQALMLALNHYAKEKGYEDLETTMQEATYNRRRETAETYKLVLMSRDQDDYEKIFAYAHDASASSNGTIERPLGKKTKNLIEAFNYFVDKIVACFNDEKGDRALLAKHFESIFTQAFVLVRIGIGKEENAQAIFESLNARGELLSISALIKNKIMQHPAIAQDSTYQTEVYKRFWQPFDHDKNDDEIPFWEQDIGNGTNSLSYADHFFLSYYVYKQQKATKLKNLYKDFMSDIACEELGKGDFELLLKDIAAKRELYKEFANETDSLDAFVSFVEALQALRNTTSFPILFALHDHWQPESEAINAAEQQLVFDMLESFLFRRAVCGEHAFAFGTFSAQLAKALANNKGEAAGWIVYNFLAQPEKTAFKWPDDAEFARGWQDYRPYAGLVSMRDQRAYYALNRLNTYLEGIAHDGKNNTSVEAVTSIASEKDLPKDQKIKKCFDRQFNPAY